MTSLLADAAEPPCLMVDRADNPSVGGCV